MALVGCILEYGGSPSAISMAVMPSDQMSVLWLYLLFFRISGDIQKGLPMTLSWFPKVVASWAEIY